MMKPLSPELKIVALSKGSGDTTIRKRLTAGADIVVDKTNGAELCDRGSL